MTDAELQALRATMPWTEQSLTTGRHTIIRIVDNAGREVPLLTLTRFMVTISGKLAVKEGSNG